MTLLNIYISIICICLGFRTSNFEFMLEKLQSTKLYVRNYQKIMQNKPNSLNVQIYINVYDIKDYQNFIPLAGYKNKPNSNPIAEMPKMNANIYNTIDCRNKTAFRRGKNKPNSNPISSKPKMSANSLLAKDYENETTFRPKKTKPKQTQFLQRPCGTIDGFENFSYCTKQT